MTVLQVHDALPRLREAFHRGRLIPFLGAGFSMPLRLPSWAELVAWMAERLGWEPELFALHGTAAQMAEFFALEPNAFDELVHEMTVRFDGAGKRVWGTYYGGPGGITRFGRVARIAGGIVVDLAGLSPRRRAATRWLWRASLSARARRPLSNAA